MSNKKNLQNEVVVEEKIPLKVDSIEISTIGLLTVNFNKPILKPPLEITNNSTTDDSRSKDEQRALSQLLDVNDFVSITV